MEKFFKLLERFGFTSEAYCRGDVVTKLGLFMGISLTLVLFFAGR